MTSTSPLKDPSIRDPGGACFYLDLPRELRDMIHSYALTYDHGLVCAPSDLYWSRDPALWFPKLEPFWSYERPPKQNIEGVTTLGDPNTLRLVCHQTRAETRGLLLNSNNIGFHCARSHSKLYRSEVDQIDMNEVFRSFYHQCSEANKDRLRQITIFLTCEIIVLRPEAYNILARYMRDYAHHKNISFNLRLTLDDVPVFGSLGVTQVFSLIFQGPPTSRFAEAYLQRGPEKFQYVREEFIWRLGSKDIPENVRFSIREESPEHMVKG